MKSLLAVKIESFIGRIDQFQHAPGPRRLAACEANHAEDNRLSVRAQLRGGPIFGKILRVILPATRLQVAAVGSCREVLQPEAEQGIRHGKQAVLLRRLALLLDGDENTCDIFGSQCLDNAGNKDLLACAQRKPGGELVEAVEQERYRSFAFLLETVKAHEHSMEKFLRSDIPWRVKKDLKPVFLFDVLELSLRLKFISKDLVHGFASNPFIIAQGNDDPLLIVVDDPRE